MTHTTDLPYRPCVGIMLFNHDGLVFVAQRLDQTREAWQMPQGGIDEGETPEAAALRELKEEIGTNNVAILDTYPQWLSYDLPASLMGTLWKGRYRGQRMKWFAMRFLGADAEIDLNTPHPEFSQWRWAPLNQIPDLIVPFKKTLYQTLADHFKDIPNGL